MRRVLQVLHKGTEAYGGIEHFIQNVCHSMDSERVNAEYLYIGHPCPPMQAEIESEGGRTYLVPVTDQEDFHKYLVFFREMRRFLREHRGEYDCIHINDGHPLVLLSISAAAKFAGGGYRVRVFVHAHSAQKLTDSRFPIVLWLAKECLRFTADEFFACSALAVQRVFPVGMLKNRRCHILHNAIDIEQFRFDRARREEIRSAWNLSEDFVVGHIGRFSWEKNHGMLLEVFSQVKKLCPEAKLLLVGDGNLMSDVRAQVETLGLISDVIFTGSVDRETASAAYQAMDVFVLPSRYEGFPVVGVEAQTSGLPMIVSDAVTRELNLTGLVEFLPLDAGAPVWAERILAHRGGERRDCSDAVRAAGYDINAAAEELTQYYGGNCL